MTTVLNGKHFTALTEAKPEQGPDLDDIKNAIADLEEQAEKLLDDLEFENANTLAAVKEIRTLCWAHNREHNLKADLDKFTADK